jgi:hypothetical protein
MAELREEYRLPVSKKAVGARERKKEEGGRKLCNRKL